PNWAPRCGSSPRADRAASRGSPDRLQECRSAAQTIRRCPASATRRPRRRLHRGAPSPMQRCTPPGSASRRSRRLLWSCQNWVKSVGRSLHGMQNDFNVSPMTTISRRVSSVDIVRGAVMVLMALDHVLDYVTNQRIRPEDLSKASVALFATRWVTHFCAPAFSLLAGVGVGLYMSRG